MRESNINCMLGVLDVLESGQVRACNDQISNGGLMNKHIIDYPRKLDRLGSFNEECQRIELAADLAICRADTRETRFSNLLQEDITVENHNANQMIVKRLQHEKTESDLLHHLVKTQYTARDKGKKSAHKSSLCHNSASLIHRPSSISAGTSLNKLRIAEILGLICTQDADSKTKHVQRRAKTFVDQMFIDRRFTGKQETSSECKPFSDALEVLSTNKDLFMEFLPEPNPMLARFIKPVLDAKFSEFESTYDISSENGNLKKHLLEKIDHKCQYASETHFTRHLDKIVILKSAPQNIRYSENITCHSSGQSNQKLGGKVPNPKPASFSFKEMKRKLKHTFGGSRKGTKQLSMKVNSNKLACDRPILGVGDCICRGMDTVNSFSSFKNVEIRGHLNKKSSPRSIDGPDNICMKETVRRKIDFPSVGLSMNQEFDVIFEAKRQLYARVNDVNALENTKSKRSPKTVSQILSSPEHDFCLPISPKQDILHCSGSAQMRFSTYRNSPSITRSSCLIMNERQRICPSPLRPNKEVICDDDYKIHECIETLETKKISSMIQSSDDHEYFTVLSETDEVYFNNGEQEIEEIDCIQKHELCTSEVESESTSTVKRSDVTELLEDDEIAVHFVDTHSENETLTSTLDDIPFTPLSSCDSTKYQEHRSPVSVLEPFFTDVINSPPSTTFQTVERSLQPLRLDFEECSSDSTPHDPEHDIKTCKHEQDQISVYVHLVLQASCMNWDHLSDISPLPEELIHASLFDELEFPLIDPNLNPKLLFDHIHEVLLEIYQWNFSSPPWLTFIKPKITSLPLEEVVLDEIMKQADFYVLPQTEKRTLNQIVSKDIANSRTWLDVRLDTEQVVIQVSEDFIEELILDVLLEFHT